MIKEIFPEIRNYDSRISGKTPRNHAGLRTIAFLFLSCTKSRRTEKRGLTASRGLSRPQRLKAWTTQHLPTVRASAARGQTGLPTPRAPPMF